MVIPGVGTRHTCQQFREVFLVSHAVEDRMDVPELFPQNLAVLVWFKLYGAGKVPNRIIHPFFLGT